MRTREEIITLIPKTYIEWKQEIGVVAGSMMGQAEVDEFIKYILTKLKT